jgi:hypothetical protein
MVHVHVYVNNIPAQVPQGKERRRPPGCKGSNHRKNAGRVRSLVKRQKIDSEKDELWSTTN